LRKAEGIGAVGDIRRVQAAASQNDAGPLWNRRFGDSDGLSSLQGCNEEMLRILETQGMRDERTEGILSSTLDIAKRLPRLSGQAFGSLALAALVRHHDNDFSSAVAEGDRWMQTGNVHTIPTVEQPSGLLLLVDDKPTMWGEHKIDEYVFPEGFLEQRHVRTEPHLSEHGPVSPLSERARNSIVNADALALAAGSWLTSINVSLGADGTVEALHELKDRGGRLFAFANLVEDRTVPGFSVGAYNMHVVRATDGTLDVCYYNNRPEVLPDREGIVPLHYDDAHASADGIRGEALATTVVQTYDPNDKLAHTRSPVAHDPEAMANITLTEVQLAIANRQQSRVLA